MAADGAIDSNSDMLEPGRAEGSHREGRRYRLVLADDHPDVRREISRLLDPEFEVLRAVSDGAALVSAVVELRPDAVISDIEMPKPGGIEAASEILERGLCEAIVVLSMYFDAELVQAAVEAGIRGYVLKLDAGDELIPAVYAVLSGERYLSSGVRGTRGTDKG